MDFQQNISHIKYLQNIDTWLMNQAEKILLFYFLERIKPEMSIEIGTHYGGSLKPISDFSKKVYSFDVYHGNVNKKNFSNVKFITGNSRETVPKIIAKLNQSKKHLEFVLIDGDHSKYGVKSDIENILKYEPKKPLYILMHDSFNPICRSGMLEADWKKSPYVHFVDVDFLHGTMYEKESFGSQLWHGFALAILLPEKRTFQLSISRSEEFMYKSAVQTLSLN